MAKSFGSAAMTNSIADLAADTDTYFLLGTNTTETHPVLGYKIKNAVLQRGAKLIVADPRRTELAGMADVHLDLRPGTDVALLNGIMNVIIREGLSDLDFIARRCENYDALAELVEGYDPDTVAEITGVTAAKVSQAARLYANSPAAAILFTMGLTQHTHGTDNVLSVGNLAMLTGNLGRPGGGVNALRGQNNVQGGSDMGCLPDQLPGYRPVSDRRARNKVEQLWGVNLPSRPGLTLGEIINWAHDGDIKALIIIGENPLISDPDINHVREAIERLELFVCSDIFLTETARMADIVFPAACFAEKDGTFTNTERRVQRVRKAVEPPGEAKPDWWLLCQLGSRMGYPLCYPDSEAVFNEIRQVIPAYAGITYQRLKEAGIQWPCPDENHSGTSIMHTTGFPRGRGMFIPVDYIAPYEVPNERYPFYLTTGRSLYHYHSGSMTRRAQALDEHYRHPQIEISPLVAEKMEIKDGEMVRLTTQRGSIKAQAYLQDALPENIIFMTFHFAEAAANILTHATLDPVAKIPEFKVVAARLEKE